jgi:hypothetical protein
MATAITDEQRIELRKSPRFEDMTRASVSNHASYLHGLNGGSLPPGMTHEQWAKQRFFIAEPIVNHPDQAEVQSWVSMFAVALKGFVIWDGNVDATIAFMIANNIFEQITVTTYALKGENIKF